MFRPSLALAVLLLVTFGVTSCQPQRPTPTIVASATPAPTVATRDATPSATPTAKPSATPAPSTTPTPESYPPPTPVRAKPPAEYPEPVEVDVSQGRALSILALQPGPTSVRVSGSTTLPEDACIQTWLYANGKLVDWWPAEDCAGVRAGAWVLSIERPPLSQQDPPGARYTIIAKSLAHPEAGEARLVMTAFIPYHGKGN